MPYIPQQDRLKFQCALDAMAATIRAFGISNGEFNYLLTKIALLYLEKHTVCYSTISDVVKTFECAKLEFYRRVAGPYEDKKAEQNGDCY